MLTKNDDLLILATLVGFIGGLAVGLVFNWDFNKRCVEYAKNEVMKVASAPVELLPPPEGMK